MTARDLMRVEGRERRRNERRARELAVAIIRRQHEREILADALAIYEEHTGRPGHVKLRQEVARLEALERKLTRELEAVEQRWCR